jgi:hypothetical protein
VSISFVVGKLSLVSSCYIVTELFLISAAKKAKIHADAMDVSEISAESNGATVHGVLRMYHLSKRAKRIVM